jgi:hypothetical protein
MHVFLSLTALFMLAPTGHATGSGVHVTGGACSAVSGDVDKDKDGLSDFHELHKYGTDPNEPDSDGDGIADGEWRERREYAYTVRTVVQVMKPVTIDFLNDDFQDARVLDETDVHVELEVILYPFNTVNRSIGADEGWNKPAKELKPWLEPGPTSDWTPKMRRELLAALAQEGIAVDALSDREVVERVSHWLMERSKFHDGFSTFITAFDAGGRPYMPEELARAVAAEQRTSGLTLEQQWERELSARGMLEQRTHGSCTSSAIYLSGCLRAVGIPTRTVLCIPLVDGNDAAERALADRQLKHNEVRRIVKASAEKASNGWTSHTFNEVWVDGRWRRLNYSKLGQDILDTQCLGLMIHVGTFRDWADARMPESVGRRQQLRRYDDLFGGANPYSTIALRDEFGVHCKLVNPPADEQKISVDGLHWTDDASLPRDIRESCAERGRFGLIASVRGVTDAAWLREFLSRTDLQVFMEAAGHTRLSTTLDVGCWWIKNGHTYIYLPLGEGDRSTLARGVEYQVSARNANAGFRCELSLPITRESP